MKKLPKTVTIGGHPIEIRQRKRVLKHEDRDALGLCNTLDGHITIYSDMNWSRVEEVFLHESLHAISDTYGVGLTEKQVTILARGLYAFLKNNSIDFKRSHDRLYTKKRK